MHVPGLNAAKVGYTARSPWIRRRELTVLTGFYHKVVYAKWIEDARAWEAAINHVLRHHRRLPEGGMGEYYLLGPRPPEQGEATRGT